MKARHFTLIKLSRIAKPSWNQKTEGAKITDILFRYPYRFFLSQSRNFNYLFEFREEILLKNKEKIVADILELHSQLRENEITFFDAFGKMDWDK